MFLKLALNICEKSCYCKNCVLLSVLTKLGRYKIFHNDTDTYLIEQIFFHRIMSTLCWKPFPRLKMFFFLIGSCLEGALVPILNPPPPTTSGMPGGQPKIQRGHFWHIFFTKLVPEPELGATKIWIWLVLPP